MPTPSDSPADLAPHELTAAAASPPLAPVDLVLQRGLVARWRSWLDEQVACKQTAVLTRDGYGANIRYWLDYLEKHARTDRPTPATVQAYVIFIQDSGLEPETVNHKSVHEPATVNAYLNAVKAFYRWCETGDVYPSIARSVRVMREHRDGPLPALTHDQVVDLVGAIPEDTLVHLRDRAMIALIYATAFRTVSVARADIADVQFDLCSIAHQPKGHHAKDAMAVIPRSVADLLSRYLEARKAKIGIPESKDPIPLFIALDRRCAGQRITARTIRRQVLHYMELAGHAVRRDGDLVNPGVFSAHSLRRSAAVTTADAVGLEVAQGLLGHASLETTKKAYARTSLERKLRENAARLDSL